MLDAKALLHNIQWNLVRDQAALQAAAGRACQLCGKDRRIKDYRERMLRTLDSGDVESEEMRSTRDVIYNVDGLTMVAYLARPQGEGPWPAVLIGHDGVGLESYQRSRADDLAARGYLAFAMDYHGGEVFFGRPEAMLARTMPLMADVGRMQAIGSTALDNLLAEPGVDPDRLVALGYGAGGRILLELARAGAPFKAIALVHPGLPEANAEDWTDVSSSFLLCTGSEDPLCTPDQILSFGRTLQNAGLDWRANIYGGAKHAFWARPKDLDESPATVPGVGPHPIHAARAWQAVLDQFEETLEASSKLFEQIKPLL